VASTGKTFCISASNTVHFLVSPQFSYSNHHIITMTESPSSSSSPAKRAKTVDSYDELCETAMNHFQSFLESCGPENPEGDVDELVHLLQVLQNEPKANVAFTINVDNGPPNSKVDLLPVLHSVAATLVADDCIGAYLCSNDKDGDAEERNQLDAEIRRLLALALHCLPTNASTLSISANLARMTQTLSLQNIANLYVEAAKHASEVRSCAIQWLADDSPIQDDIIKEWIECLLLNHVVGVELEGDEEEEELEDDEENDDKEKDNDGTEDKAEESEAAKKSGGVITKKDGTDQEDAKDTEELESWSSSAVESTARFMAATLFSCSMSMTWPRSS
jgi:hypothetical protein